MPQCQDHAAHHSVMIMILEVPFQDGRRETLRLCPSRTEAPHDHFVALRPRSINDAGPINAKGCRDHPRLSTIRDNWQLGDTRTRMIMKSSTSKKLLPSMLHATPAEVAAFRARLRDGCSGPEVHEATPEEVSAYRRHLADLPDDDDEAYRAFLRDVPDDDKPPTEIATRRAYLQSLPDSEKVLGFQGVERPEVMPDPRRYGGYAVPPGVPPDEADRAFGVIFDKIVAYLSSPDPLSPDPPYRVGRCRSCGAEDCFATAEPWAAKLIYRDGEVYLTGGFCCAHAADPKEHDWGPVANCAHPMLEK
jgi:hypothetical protein